MKNKIRKMEAVLAAGIVCITLLNACSAEKPSDLAEQDIELSETAELSALLEDPDIEQEFQEEEPDTPQLGLTNETIGEFETKDIYGYPYTQEIFQDYELTMVNVFATWCSPCVAEIPDLEKLHNTMADRGVNVVGVVLDVLNEKGELDQDVLKRAQLLAEQTGATYTFLLPDDTYMNGRLIGIEAIPETFFVDKNGNIVGETYSGSGSLEDWTNVVEQELDRLGEE